MILLLKLLAFLFIFIGTTYAGVKLLDSKYLIVNLCGWGLLGLGLIGVLFTAIAIKNLRILG